MTEPTHHDYTRPPFGELGPSDEPKPKSRRVEFVFDERSKMTMDEISKGESDLPLTPPAFRTEEQGGEYGSRTAQLEGEIEFARAANVLLRAELAAALAQLAIYHTHADNEAGMRLELEQLKAIVAQAPGLENVKLVVSAMKRAEAAEARAAQAIQLMREAIDNCETCRGTEQGCARCGTFDAFIREMTPAAPSRQPGEEGG